MLPRRPELLGSGRRKKEFGKLEAMIPLDDGRQRQEREELTPPRRRRVSLGSGTTVDDVESNG